MGRGLFTNRRNPNPFGGTLLKKRARSGKLNPVVLNLKFASGVINISIFGLGFNIVTSVLFWGAALLVLVRVIVKSLGRGDVGLIKLPSPKATVEKTVYALLSEKSGVNINIKIIIFGLCIRLVMLLLAYIFLRIEGRDAYLSFAGVFRSFNRWDAPHYLVLADIGYSYIENGRHLFVVFFPLYPYLIRLVNVLAGSYFASAYIVSFAAYAAGLCYLYRLVRLDFGESTAWWAVALISIFPHSIFLGAPHTESLFILTTAMTLYYIRTHKWLLAGMAGALATATRMVGVILIAAAAVEFVMTYELFSKMRKGKWNEFFDLVLKKGLFILLMFAGTIVYLLINWRITGDPFRFMYYQRINWNNGFRYFGLIMRGQFYSIRPYIGNMWENSMLYIAVPNILGFGFTVWMIAYASLRRYNAGYIVYALGYTFVSFSMAWLISGGRYAVALVPSFVFLADYVSRKLHRQIIVPLIFILLLLPILRMYVLGGFVM